MMLTILTACVGLLIERRSERLTGWPAPIIAAKVLAGILIARTRVERVHLVGRCARDRR